jgi:hypothetical protein
MTKTLIVAVDTEHKLIEDRSDHYLRESLNKLPGDAGNMNQLIGTGVSSEKIEMHEKTKSTIKQTG